MMYWQILTNKKIIFRLSTGFVKKQFNDSLQIDLGKIYGNKVKKEFTKIYCWYF